MKNLLRTLFTIALVMISALAVATPIETTSLSNDTLNENSTNAIDSLSRRLKEMESYIESKDKNTEQQEIWSRKKYWKIGMASPNLKRTDGEEMDWKTEFSIFIQRGKTVYLHKKPIAGMIKFGIDWGLYDLTYSKLKLKNTEIPSSTTQPSEGFDDIVSENPSMSGMLSSMGMGVNLGMHKIDYSLHVGPSISVNPWNKLIGTAYFHVRPTASGIIQNDVFSYGFGCNMAAGVSVAYKLLSLGIEGVWGSIKYTQNSFKDNSDEDDDSTDDDKVSIFDTKKFKLKQSGIRFYLAFRL